MTSEQEMRLKQTINNATLEIEGLTVLHGELTKNLMKWRKVRQEAANELSGLQMALNLCCSTCGD